MTVLPRLPLFVSNKLCMKIDILSLDLKNDFFQMLPPYLSPQFLILVQRRGFLLCQKKFIEDARNF